MPCADFRFLPNRVAVAVVFAAAVLLATPTATLADGDITRPDAEAVEGWFPWQEGIGGARKGLAPADIDAISDHLEAVALVLRRSDALVKGAEIWPSREVLTGRARGGSRDGPAGYRLDLRIYRPNLQEAGSSGGKISLLANSPFVTADLLFTDSEGPIHLGRPVVGEAAGFPVHLLSPERARARETGWVITPGGRSQWVPVSRERWIRALIGDARGKLADFEREGTEGSQQRRARFERAYEGIKKGSPENAEKLREQFEAGELGISRQADALRAGDHKALEKLGRRDLAMLGRVIPRLEEELAAMPPDRRGEPAYCCEAAPVSYFAPPSKATRPSLLVEPDDKRALALLAPDPGYFRSGLPVTAMQSITVTQRMTRADRGWEGYMEEVRRGVDWRTLEALLAPDAPNRR